MALDRSLDKEDIFLINVKRLYKTVSQFLVCMGLDGIECHRQEHTGKVGFRTPTLDPGPRARGSGPRPGWISTWDPGPRTLSDRDDQVEPWTRDPKIFKWDQGPGTPEVGTGTLINSLLVGKFECCNKSVETLLEN